MYLRSTLGLCSCFDCSFTVSLTVSVFVILKDRWSIFFQASQQLKIWKTFVFRQANKNRCSVFDGTHCIRTEVLNYWRLPGPLAVAYSFLYFRSNTSVWILASIRPLKFLGVFFIISGSPSFIKFSISCTLIDMSSLEHYCAKSCRWASPWSLQTCRNSINHTYRILGRQYDVIYGTFLFLN